MADPAPGQPEFYIDPSTEIFCPTCRRWTAFCTVGRCTAPSLTLVGAAS